MKKFLIKIFTIAMLFLPSCKTMQYVPIETGTTVHVIDSVAIHYLDSIRIYEATRYREMGWLTDTLKVKTERGTEVTVYADTTKELLTADVKEKPIEEKVKYIYKDRVEYKDSVRVEEKPVPVEKIVKVVPKFYRIFAFIGVLLTVLFGILGYFKLKSSGLISKIVKLFS